MAEEFRPVWWYVALTGLATAAAWVPLGLLGLNVSLFSLIVVPVACMLALYFTLKLGLSPHGVAIGGDLGGRLARWDQVELRTGRWGESLRSLPGTPRRERINVWLPMYEARWRYGRIDRCIKEWAPELLEGLPDHLR